MRRCRRSILAGLSEKDAGLETPDEGDDVSPFARRAIQIEGRDRVNLYPRREDRAKVKAAGQDADNSGLLAIDVECLADDCRIGVELASPPSVGKQNHRGGSAARIVRIEGASHGWLYSEHLEEVCNDINAGCGNGSAAKTEAEIPSSRESEIPGHILIRTAVSAEFVIGVGGIGSAGETAFGRRWRDPHQLLRTGERKRTQEEIVDQSEDG